MASAACVALRMAASTEARSSARRAVARRRRPRRAGPSGRARAPPAPWPPPTPAFAVVPESPARSVDVADLGLAAVGMIGAPGAGHVGQVPPQIPDRHALSVLPGVLHHH